MAWTNINKSATAVFSGISKNTATFSTISKGGYNHLLTEVGGYLLLEDGSAILLENSVLPVWSNVPKN
jgi:hypothetical protein